MIPRVRVAAAGRDQGLPQFLQLVREHVEAGAQDPTPAPAAAPAATPAAAPAAAPAATSARDDGSRGRSSAFNLWKNRTQKYASGEGLSVDLWAADDPYNLAVVAREAFERGSSPRTFVLEIFADDLAAREGDEASFNESLTGEDHED